MSERLTCIRHNTRVILIDKTSLLSRCIRVCLWFHLYLFYCDCLPILSYLNAYRTAFIFKLVYMFSCIFRLRVLIKLYYNASRNTRTHTRACACEWRGCSVRTKHKPQDLIRYDSSHLLLLQAQNRKKEGRRKWRTMLRT